MHFIDNQDICLMKSAKLQRFSATIAKPLFGTSKHNVSVKSKLKHPPPGIPRAFDVFSCPGGREFDEFSLPGGRAFDYYS